VPDGNISVLWRPDPGPQTALIACPIFEVFYGGARGGGKTEGSIGDWLEHQDRYGINAVGVFFRRTLRQLEEVIARTKEIFPQIGAKYNEQKSEWVMKSGARLKFRYIERDSDAQEYQGHSYTRVYVEEATNFPSPAPINMLRATLRSARGVPVALRLTGNPGGPGHNWVKARYITPAPEGYKIIKEWVEGYDGESGQFMERVFIPSKLKDNRSLKESGGLTQYVGQIRQAGSEQLVKAWLDGNWEMIDGAFFDCWKPEKHILDVNEWLPRIPPWSTRYRALDWGYAKPFCVLWLAVSDGTWGLPMDALVVYREWYGWTGMPNTGVRMNPDQLAAGILVREHESVAYGVADPAIWIRDGGHAIGETLAIHNAPFRRADNKRIPGWAEVRGRLVGRPQPGWDGDPKDRPNVPMLYVLSNCSEGLIRTISTIQHDEKDVEDVDTDGEDHAVDTLRYACMARPWVTKAPEEPQITYPKRPDEMTINELIEQRRQRRLGAEE